MKKFKVLCSLTIGLLLVVSVAFAQRQGIKRPQTTEPLNLESKQEATEDTARAREISFDLTKNFSLAKTPAEIVAATTQEATTTTTTEAKAEAKKEEDSEGPAEEQKIVLLVPFRLGTIFDIEILGVRFSLAIQPLGYGYGYGYGYPYYGSWYYGWGWNRYWYGSRWWGYYGPYDWRWNAWEWNYSGWYQPRRDRNRNTNPIHSSQLRDPRRTTTAARSTEPAMIAQSNIKSQIKSYPNSKVISRAQQKFNGRVAAKYAEPKQNPLLRKSNSPSTRPAVNSRSNLSRIQNTRSSASRISNQSRPISSRTALRPNPSRTGSSRVSTPVRSSASSRISTTARSSAPRSSIHSSVPRSSAVRSSGASRPSAARTSAPRAASPSRGGSVRRK